VWGGVRARRQREPGPSTVRARALVQKGDGPPRSATRYPLKGPVDPSIREVPGNSLSRKGIRALRLARLRRRTLRVERRTGPREPIAEYGWESQTFDGCSPSPPPPQLKRCSGGGCQAHPHGEAAGGSGRGPGSVAFRRPSQSLEGILLLWPRSIPRLMSWVNPSISVSYSADRTVRRSSSRTS
jgi:hypothetical protein